MKLLLAFRLLQQNQFSLLKLSMTALIIIALNSCTKDNDPIQPTTQKTGFELVIGKYLVMDSQRVDQNGLSTLTVFGKGKGADIVYNANGTYQVYQNPPVIKNYKYEAPDRIYYWSSANSMDVTQFIKIVSISGKQITFKEINTVSNKSITSYQTAE
jgi:hypothetical protein